MSTWILAVTVSFTIYHSGSGSMVTTNINETFQRPLETLEKCERYAYLRSLEWENGLSPHGAIQIEVKHNCIENREG